jgi:hypothetical protein
VPKGYELCSAAEGLPEGRCLLSTIDPALTLDEQRAVALAHARLRMHGGRRPQGYNDREAQVVNLNQVIDLKRTGCFGSETITVREALKPLTSLDWLSVFATTMALGVAITLLFSLVVYGLVRAIGWVIGGFAAS